MKKQSEGEWKDNHCTVCGINSITNIIDKAMLLTS